MAHYRKGYALIESMDMCMHACTYTDTNTNNHNDRLVAFALGKFAAAQAAFERGLALRGGADVDSRKYGAWLRKCRLELEEEQGGGKASSTSTSSAPAVVAAAPPAPAVATAVAMMPTGPAKYQYYQSGTYVTVTLLQKGVAEEAADVAIEPRRVGMYVGLGRAPFCVCGMRLYHRGADPSSSMPFPSTRHIADGGRQGGRGGVGSGALRQAAL